MRVANDLNAFVCGSQNKAPVTSYENSNELAYLGVVRGRIPHASNR